MYVNLIFIGSESPAKTVGVTHKSFDDFTADVIDLAYIRELLWAMTNNLSGFKAAIKEQVDQPLFPPAREHATEDWPQLTAVYAIFDSRLPLGTGLGQRHLFRA